MPSNFWSELEGQPETLRSLGWFSVQDLEVKVVLSGSIFKDASGIILEQMADELRKAAPLARLVNDWFVPGVGALLLGLQARGVQVDANVQENIERSSRSFNLLRTR